MKTFDNRKTALQNLCDGGIFYIVKEGELFLFTEACDNYFEMSLSKEQVNKLINELKDLVK